MVQYQSFPDAYGDSNSLEKLKSLRLPDLNGKRFLDIGCNEGFFCGYACYAGAAEVLGIDRDPHFIQRAQMRFPQARFVQQSWDDLPDAQFDVILFASALHYASEPETLLRQLLARLSPDGVLVLELGVLDADQSAWLPVDRGMDVCHYPTWRKIRELLQGWAWKLIAPGVSQAGDPVPRHVLHICPQKAQAFLLLQEPGVGKSSIARKLSANSGIKVIVGDEVIAAIARGELSVAPRLQELVRQDYNPQATDRKLEQICAAGLLPALAEVFLRIADGADFFLDCYVANLWHALLRQSLMDHGYLPVILDWLRPGLPLQSLHIVQTLAEGYFTEMNRQIAPHVAAVNRENWHSQGFVDQIALRDGKICVEGWAVQAGNGQEPQLPPCLLVNFAHEQSLHKFYQACPRPDVQKRLQLPHPMFGFRLECPAPAGITADDLPRLAREVQVFGGLDAEQLTGPYGCMPEVGVRVAAN